MAPRRRDPRADLGTAVARFDREGLLAEVAGLMTLAKNAGLGLRLDTIAEFAAGEIAVPGGRTPTRRDLVALCNGEAVRSLSTLEDPPEYPLTEPIVFDGRAYIAFTGQGEEKAHRSERLFEAILRLADRLDASLIQRWVDLVVAGLGLSEAVALRAGIRSNESAIWQPTVTVPETALSNRVRWTRADLSVLSGALGVPVTALDSLTMNMGDANAQAEPDRGALVSRPLVRLQDGDIVVTVDYLLSAMTHYLLTDAQREGVLDLVASAYADSVHEGVLASLTMLGLALDDSATLPTTTLPCTRAAALRAGDDALMVVVTITEPLDEFNAAQVHDNWEPPASYRTDLVSWTAALAEWLQRAEPAEQWRMLAVVISLPAGRGAMFGHPPPGPGIEFLALGPGALRVIALLEAGEPLALHRFAIARRNLHDRVRVIVWSALDEYDLYRANGHSFYFSDDALPNAMSIASDAGSRPRQNAADRLQLQSVPMQDGQHVVVMSRYTGEAAPIFAPYPRLPGPALVVRLDGVDVWFHAPRWTELPEGSRRLYLDVLDALAYWAWQAGDGVIAGLAGPLYRSVVTLQFEIVDPASWSTTADEVDEDSVSFAADPAGGRAMIWLNPSFSKSLMRPDNAGERWLASVVASALRELLGGSSDPVIVMPIVDAVAPLGPKKMLTVFPASGVEDVGPDTNVPRWRKVDEWEAAQVLDDLAAHFAATGERPGASGDVATQTTLINRAVDYFYSQLVADIATLSPAGLVESLLAQNEALLRAAALRRIELPTRVACFGEHSDMVERLREELRDHAIASISNRFLIEFVAAQPPTGTRTLSDRTYDRLLALAASIVDYGFQSDVTHNRLATTSARVLPSGRLGTASEDFGRAVQSHVRSMIPGQINNAREAFASFWAMPATGAAAPPPGWDAAFTAEFGYSLTDFAQALGALVNACPFDQPTVTMARAKAIVDVAAASGVPEGTVAMIVDDLVLAPRPNFLNPPAGFKRDDIWPWLFNRRLSFIRRPIVARGAPSDDELVWGYRGVYGSGRQVMSLIMEGRLAATSKEMLVFQSKQTAELSDAFVDRVASIVGSVGFDARLKVDKFGPVRLEVTKGHPLGDVDVLGIDGARMTLWAIECKNLVFAKTPHELASELQDLEDADDGMVAKHQRRVDWLRGNLPVVASELGLPAGPWRVEGLIVVHSDLVSVHLRSMGMPIVPEENLRTWLIQQPAPTVAAPYSVTGPRTKPERRRKSPAARRRAKGRGRRI